MILMLSAFFGVVPSEFAAVEASPDQTPRLPSQQVFHRAADFLLVEILQLRLGSNWRRRGTPSMEVIDTESLRASPTFSVQDPSEGLPSVAIITTHLFPSRCIVEKGIPSHSVGIFGDQRLVVVF
ncbi:hypothetical protein QOT17_006379 [Balamuthia mandrillaris]